MMGEPDVQQGPLHCYNNNNNNNNNSSLMMRERLQQHQQLQELFAHDDSLEVEYAIDSNTSSSIMPHNNNGSRQRNSVLSTSYSANRVRENNSHSNSNILDQQQQQQQEQQQQQQHATQDAGTSGLIISTHYYSNIGGRRTYHNYYYDYHNAEQHQNTQSTTSSNSNSDNNNLIISKSATSTLTAIKTDNNNNNNKNLNIKQAETTTPTALSLETTTTTPSTSTLTMNSSNNQRRGTKRSTNSNNNSNNNDIDSNNNNNSSSRSSSNNTPKRPMLMNNNDLNENMVDSAMLHAIREKVLHTPAGTNFDVICVSTPNGGRTIATHSKEQVSSMRIYDHHQASGPLPVLTSSLPVSLLKERFLISHLPTPKPPQPSQSTTTLNKPTTHEVQRNSWVATPSGNSEAPSTFVNAGQIPVARHSFSNLAGVAQFGNILGCNSSAWYRHMIEMTGMSVRCTDIFTEQEYIVKMVNEPMDKVKQAYYKLQSDKHNLRSTYYGHRLVRAAVDIVPYVSSMGDTSTERSYIIVEPKTATYDEIAIWTGGCSLSNIISMGRNITGHAVEDLHSYIRRKRRLCENEARSLFHQITETVRVCHKNGIILRDLKLKRFYFIDHERKRLQYESLEGCMIPLDPKNDTLSDKIGCPLYTAPELLCTAPTYRGKPADMWSLGVILYTMLVGQYPFYEKGSCSLIQIIRQCSAYLPSSLTRPARSLIMALLNKSWPERLRIDQIFFMPWMRDYKPEWSCIPYDVVVKNFADPEDFIENLKFTDKNANENENVVTNNENVEDEISKLNDMRGNSEQAFNYNPQLPPVHQNIDIDVEEDNDTDLYSGININEEIETQNNHMVDSIEDVPENFE